MADTLGDLYKQGIPLPARKFAGYVLGDRSPITEKDLTEDELAALRTTVNRANQRNVDEQDYLRRLSTMPRKNYDPATAPYGMVTGDDDKEIPITYSQWQKDLKSRLKSYDKTKDRTSFSYKDYYPKEVSESADIYESPKEIIEKMYTDPAYRVKNTFGSAKAYNEKGKTIIRDMYGFSDKHEAYPVKANASALDIVKEYYDSPKALAEVMYSKYGNPSRQPVEINLNPTAQASQPKVDPIDEMINSGSDKLKQFGTWATKYFQK
jgi:hypothetical protein